MKFLKEYEKESKRIVEYNNNIYTFDKEIVLYQEPYKEVRLMEFDESLKGLVEVSFNDKNKVKKLGSGYIDLEGYMHLEKDKEVIKLKEVTMDRREYIQGGCAEYAVALMDFLLKDKKIKQENLSFGKILGKIKDEEYPEEYYNECCHIVVVNNITKKIYDVNGVSKFDKDNDTYVFLKEPKEIFLETGLELEDVNFFYGGNEYDLFNAERYIANDTKVTKDIKKDIYKSITKGNDNLNSVSRIK